MKEKWILQTKRADFSGLAARFGLDPVTVRLMVNRGCDTEEKIDRYINAGTEEMYPPHLLKDLDRGAELVLGAVRAGGHITVASDYDADGICSGQILKEGLRAVGAEVTVKTPDRTTEGYGLNERIVREAAAEGASLLLTCDNGIAAFEPVKLAKSLGMTVVITDHHEVPYTLRGDGSKEYKVPAADAVIDPAQADCAYPYKGICGATVAWKLICAIFELAAAGAADAAPCISGERADQILNSLLELAAFATITDVCDLNDENRIIVREGFAGLRRTSRPGLIALASVNSVDLDNINSWHVGFVLGPCINAAGRLADADAAFALLDAKTPEEALPFAQKLKELNDSRKNLTLEGFRQAMSIIGELERGEGGLPPVAVLHLPGVHESLAGIIAGRVRERINRPVIVLTDTADVCGKTHEAQGKDAGDSSKEEAEGADGVTGGHGSPKDGRSAEAGRPAETGRPADAGTPTDADRLAEADRPADAGKSAEADRFRKIMYKGSGRSIEAYNLFEGLQACSDLLDHFGGHPMAAGLTIPAENVAAFSHRLCAQCGLTEEDFIPVVRIDVPMPLGYITEKLIDEFSLLEPTGKGNPQPLFAENYFRVRSIRTIGRDRVFFKLHVENRAGTVMEALYFGDAEGFEADVRGRFGDAAWERAMRGLSNPIELMLAYRPSVNEYRGEKNLQITISNYTLL